MYVSECQRTLIRSLTRKRSLVRSQYRPRHGTPGSHRGRLGFFRSPPAYVSADVAEGVIGRAALTGDLVVQAELHVADPLGQGLEDGRLPLTGVPARPLSGPP